MINAQYSVERFLQHTANLLFPFLIVGAGFPKGRHSASGLYAGKTATVFAFKPHCRLEISRLVQKPGGDEGVAPALLAMLLHLQSSLLLILHLLVLRVAAQGNCTSLLSLSISDVVITDAVRLVAGTNFSASADPTCFTPTYVNSVNICRVSGTVTTSPSSSVKFEMWLPDTWYGRVLTAGNAALGGCKLLSFVLRLRFILVDHEISLLIPGVIYPSLDHGSSLNFATIGTNNGHDGLFNAAPFLLPSQIESVTDFSHRAVHVAAKIGKQIASSYYGAEPHHSYYNGCSAGGRQGISVASRYPEDFDGIVAGSPAIGWGNFIGAPGILASYVAANTSSEIPLPLWNTTITQEVLKQCDDLDGKVDGIIADPSLCSWNPDALLCGPKANGSSCLTQDQVDGLKKFYRPIVGTSGDILVSAYEPGAEGDTTLPFPMNGVMSTTTVVRRPST